LRKTLVVELKKEEVKMKELYYTNYRHDYSLNLADVEIEGRNV